MATLYYVPQYRTTTLSVAGGIDASQTTGIVIASIPADVDTTQPGIVCISWSDPLDTDTAEYATYTSISATKELQGVGRGAEGYSAKTHGNGVTVAWVMSKSHINNLNAAAKTVYDEANDTLLKATGAEINTGTEDAKIVTPKAIADSNRLPAIDEDDMSSNLDTKVPTQQSVKAYVDSGTVTMTNKTIGTAQCSVRKATSNQTLTTSTITPIQMNSEIYDTNSMHNNSTNPERITVPQDGLYLVTANIAYSDSSVTGDRLTFIRKNGGDFDGQAYVFTPGSSRFHNLACIVRLSANDYITVCGYQSSGGNLDVVQGMSTNLSVVLIGAQSR